MPVTPFKTVCPSRTTSSTSWNVTPNTQSRARAWQPNPSHPSITKLESGAVLRQLAAPHRSGNPAGHARRPQYLPWSWA